MPNVSEVPAIFSFQRIDFWPRWHPHHARNSALEVILPSLLSNPPSSFSSTESLSPLQLRRAFGTKFHPKNPRKVPQQVQFQRVIDNFIKTANVRPQVPAGALPTPDQSAGTWDTLGLKIPKPPYISSLKMVGFVHFSNFLILSEKYYNLQSCWITL